MLKAVIFDFDGVVGDTMQDNCIAWQKSLNAINVKIEPEEYYLLEGMGRFQIARYFINKYKIDPSKENYIVTLKEEYYKQNNKFTIYSDIVLIFNFLNKKGIKKALVTGASISRLSKSLEHELISEFSVIITADDVINSKPDPEPYITALRKLDISSDQCLVIENAKLGIEAAKSAGCSCFALETTLNRKYLTQADLIFNTHLELLNELKRIIK